MKVCHQICLRLARRLYISHPNRATPKRKTVDSSLIKRDSLDILMDPTLTEKKIHSALLTQAKHSVIIELKSESPNREKNFDRFRSSISKIGDVESIEPLEFAVDRYIVQFRDEDSVSYLLNRGRDGKIESHMVSLMLHGGDEPQAKIAKKSRNVPRRDEAAELRELLDSQQTMEDQINILVERSLMTSADIRLRYLFLYVLENILHKHLDFNCELRPFGSSLTGGGIKGSDMDVVLLSKMYKKAQKVPIPRHSLVFDTKRDEKMHRYEDTEILRTAEKTLRTYLPDAQDVNLILQARVPILSFNFPLVNLSLDLSVNQMTGINFASIVNWYVRYDSRVRPVLVIVRKWAEARGLLSHGIDFFGFTPFVLQMLALSFLMRMNVIPPLKDIGKQRWDMFDIFQTPAEFKDVPTDNRSTEELFCDFLKYFAMHDLQGMRAHLTVGKINKVGYGNYFSIPNPFDISLNMAQNCNIEKVKEMAEEIKKTAKVLRFRRKKLTDREWGLNAILFDQT